MIRTEPSSSFDTYDCYAEIWKMMFFKSLSKVFSGSSNCYFLPKKCIFFTSSSVNVEKKASQISKIFRVIKPIVSPSTGEHKILCLYHSL